jgi:hypothetical protein
MLPATRPTPRPIREHLEPPTAVVMMERHFTLNELAAQWGFSYDFMHEHFRDEPGVICATSASKRRARGRSYGTIRVPESVALRVYARMRVGG